MMKNLPFIMLLGFILLCNSGCAALLIGTGTAVYLKSELKSTEEASLDRTWQAAQKALEDLDFYVTSKQKDTFSAKLIACRAYDRNIKINLKRRSEELTEVRIRAGTFGGELLSQLVLERLEKHLWVF